MDDIAFLGRDDLLRRVVRHLRDDRGVALAGAPWVGRTRLLREALDRIERPHLLCRPTAAGRDIPFAGLGPLAPERPDAPGTWMRELVERLPDPDVVIAVDGAQFLDAHSALVLFRAVEEGLLRVALSVWRGHAAPDAVTSLWTDGLLPRIDVEPLDRETTGLLAAHVLEGPVEEATLHALWDRCRGYPLLLREFLVASREQGRLVETDGLWASRGPLVHTPALADAARHVLGDLTEAERTGLELLSLGEPLRVEMTDRLVAPEALDRLERQDLTAVDPERGGYVLPASGWAMAIAGSLTTVRRRSLLRRLAEAAPPLAELDGAELVRVACWRVEAGLGGPGAELARAAERATALGQLDHARPLAEAALQDAPLAARLALAEILTRLDEHDAAVEVLEEAGRIGGRDGQVAAGIEAALIRFFRRGERDRAIASLEDLHGRVGGEAQRAVRATQALLVTLAGDLTQAIVLSDEVRRDEPTASRSRLDACIAGALARTWTGRLHEAEIVVREGHGLVASHGGPPDAGRLDLILQMAIQYDGRPAQAVELARDRYREALIADATGLAAVWATQLAASLIVLGEVTEALRRATEGVRLAERDDELSVLPLACAQAAMASAGIGDAAAARRWHGRVLETRVLEDARSMIMRDRAAVAVRAAESDLEGAADLAAAAALDAERMEHHVWALQHVQDAVRYGHAELVLHDAIRIGGNVDGAWAETVVRHAEVGAVRDVTGLERVADRYAELGLLLDGAETYAEAARAAASSSRASRAGLLRSRATELRRRMPDAATPSLRGLGAEPLTRREREVALLAAEGITSREVAERLVVSPRTVDNHLASVYRKLGIDGRNDLPSALGTDLRVSGHRPARPRDADDRGPVR